MQVRVSVIRVTDRQVFTFSDFLFTVFMITVKFLPKSCKVTFYPHDATHMRGSVVLVTSQFTDKPTRGYRLPARRLSQITPLRCGLVNSQIRTTGQFMGSPKMGSSRVELKIEGRYDTCAHHAGKM